MSYIVDRITEAIQDILISFIESGLSGMFNEVNDKVGTITTQVGMTPQSWNDSIFSMIKNLSDNVIIPIAGMIITFVLCYELITLVTEKNNMHEIDSWMFFKYLFKACIAVYLVTHTFEIAMAIFDLAQHVVQSSGDLISGSTSIDVEQTMKDMLETLEDLDIGELFLVALETMLLSVTMKILSVLITVILYGRMIEIYLYSSIAPIPFATLSNKEWGNIGTNYIRGLLALGFQGFFMMTCVAIYAALIQSMTISDNIHGAMFSIAAYTVILCFSLFKTGSMAKSIFNAH